MWRKFRTSSIAVLLFAGFLAAGTASEALVTLDVFLLSATKGTPDAFNVVFDDADLDGDGLQDWVGIVIPNAPQTGKAAARAYVLYQRRPGFFEVQASSNFFAYGDNTRDAVEEIKGFKDNKFKIRINNHGRYSDCGPNIRTFTYKRRGAVWQLNGEDYLGADEGGCDAPERNSTNYSMNFVTGEVVVSGYSNGRKKYLRTKRNLPLLLLKDFDANAQFDWAWAKATKP